MSVKRQGFKRWLSVLLSTAMMFSIVAVFGVVPKAKAAGMTIAQLQEKFPAGKYWNHMGSSANNPDGWTNTPCNHSANGVRYCNNYVAGGSYQCMGFAQKLGYDYTGIDPINGAGWTFIKYGTNPTGWTNAIENLKTGDIVTYYESSSSVSTHTIFITSVNGDTVHFAECNWGNKCVIRWDRTMSKSKLKTLHINKASVRVSPAKEINPNYDELGCSTAYAGWYRVKNTGGANVNSNHTTNWGKGVGVLPYDTYVYVTKAMGTGSGKLGHIIYNGVERYIAMNLFERKDPPAAADTESPVVSNVQVSNITNQGYDISCTVTDNVGVDYVKFPTWTLANGQDDLGDWGSNPLFTGNRSGNTWTYHVNVSDHNNEGGTYQTDIRAYDTSGNLGSYLEIQVGIDREDPVITDVKVTNLTSEGYDVSCTVTDNVGVNRVVFPTWTTLNDQDDIAQAWWDVNHTATRGTRNGDTWSFHVSIADHNNERGAYNTHIYAYDDAGNRVCYAVNGIVVPDPLPVVTFDANGGMAEFVTKVVNNGDVLGVLPEATQSGYIFEGWFTEPQGGTRMSHPDQYVVQGDMTLYAHWTPASGVGWHLDNGVLTIDCTGAMEDYFAVSDTPWFYARSQIRRVEVSGDVTSIGAYAFYGCDNLEEVSLPQSLQRINALAFGGCRKLASITIPRNVTDIGDYAFVGDTALRNVTFKGVAPEIGSGVFADVSADVYYPVEESGWTEDVRQGYLGSLAWLAA